MEWLRSWLLSITCAAMIAAVADALCPGGFSKTLTRMAGGLLLLLAALGPLARLDETALADALAQLRQPAGADAQAMTQDETIKSIIAQETAAYISDKAAALGIQEAQVEVRCRMTEDGFPTPESIAVRGKGSEEAWSRLEEALAADFSLAEDERTLERMDVP